MFEFVVAVVLATTVLLAFAATRGVGMAFAALLLLLLFQRSAALAVLVVVAGVAIALFVIHQRRKHSNAIIRKLLDRRY